MELLRIQKNKLFDLIVDAGLSPLQFEIIEPTRDKAETKISYKGSNYSYIFFHISTEWGGTQNHAIFSPSEKTIKSEPFSYSDWDAQIPVFQLWLVYLMREISQPDKWSELLKSSEQVRWDSQDGENSQFSFQEVEGIYASVNQAKAKIAQLELSQPQLRRIEAKLDYIADKAKSLGRIDWKNLMMGTLITLVVELALKPETTNALWAIFKEAFQRIILISLP